MPTYGTVMRAKPRVTILRGYGPNVPESKTRALPVTPGVTIVSGQVISAVVHGPSGLLSWVLGLDTANGARVPYIALQDSVDSDVRSANSLVGYSCLGDFVIQTGFFKSGESYVRDTPLTPGTSGDVGLVVPTTPNSGLPIMGYVTEVPYNLLSGGATGYPSISGVTDGNVLAFQTAWVPNPV